MRNWYRPVVFFILSAFCVISLWSAHAVFVLNDVTVYAENGPIENLQVVVLAICVFVYLGAAMEEEREKLILLSCSWLCVSFILREVDVERLNVHEALIFIGSGVGRNTMLTLGFVALLTCATARFSYYKKAALEFLISKSGKLLVLGGVFLGMGGFFDKSPSILHNTFYEETLELFGYCLILLSAANSIAGRPSVPPRRPPAK